MMHINEVTEHFDLDRVVPFFQPIMDISQDSVWRFECLARLVTPCEQTFLPSDFLSLVERQQSVERLTETIFNRSAQYFRDLNAPWNINIGLNDMLNPSLLDTLQEILKGYPNPERVSLELTAAAAMNNLNTFEGFVEKCQQLKLGVFIDHFGSSSGNINRLLSLPIDGIKIAGGLIGQIMENQQSYEFVEHFTGLAKANKIDVVAVHVEDKATLERIQDIGIRYAQGYYFCLPQPDTIAS